MTQQTVSIRSAIVDRAALSGALSIVKRVVEKRAKIAILQNVLLRGTAQGVDLVGTDLDMELRSPLNGFTCADPDFATTVPAHTLLDIVKANDCEAVEMAQSPDSLSLSFNGRNASLASLPAGDFPDPDHGDFPHSFTLPGHALRTLFERTQFAISTEETRYYLNGIYLHTSGSPAGWHTLKAVASDGHRMAVARCDAPDGAEGMPGVIVPRKAVVVVLAMLPKPKRNGPALPDVHVSVSATRVRFEIAGTVLTSKVIDGCFPDYERAIPRGNDKLATLDTNAFVAAISRVSKLSSDKGKAVKVTFDGDFCFLSVKNPDTGNSEEMIDCQFSAPPRLDYEAGAAAAGWCRMGGTVYAPDGSATKYETFKEAYNDQRGLALQFEAVEVADTFLEIGFNARYLLDLLSVYPEDRVTLRMRDAGSPMVIHTQDESLLLVLMPMRI